MAEVAKGIIDIEINTGSAASTLQALQAQINAFNLALNKGNKSQAQFSGEYTKKLQEAINKIKSEILDETKCDKKISKLKDKEVEELIFSKYLRDTNNSKNGNQSVAKFFTIKP